jgi:hypothetical protein
MSCNICNKVIIEWLNLRCQRIYGIRMSFLSLLLNWNLVGSDELTGQQGFAKHAKHIITSNHLSV